MENTATTVSLVRRMKNEGKNKNDIVKLLLDKGYDADDLGYAIVKVFGGEKQNNKK